MQTILTYATVLIPSVFFAGMAFDFIYGLIRLWDQPQPATKIYPEDAIKLISDPAPNPEKADSLVVKKFPQQEKNPEDNINQKIEQANNDPIIIPSIPQFSTVGAMTLDLHKMSIRELRTYCQENGIKGYSKYVGSKTKLIKFIETR